MTEQKYCCSKFKDCTELGGIGLVIIPHLNLAYRNEENKICIASPGFDFCPFCGAEIEDYYNREENE